MRAALLSAAALAALLPAALAQTFTNCNPLNTTGCPDMPALGGNTTFHFNQTVSSDLWNTTNGVVNWGSVEGGAEFTIKESGDSPTIKSNFYIWFGRVEIVMKAAPGKGIVSSAILESDDLDEVDFEFLGSNATSAMTNYFGKGNTTSYDRGKNFDVANTQSDWQNYTLDWTKERIQWWFNDQMLRELKYEDALGGKNFPQTPATIRLGIWSGGDTAHNDPGVVEWAGGDTDFSKSPFTMLVQSVYVQDYTDGAKTYQWADETGSYGTSIKVVNGTSEYLTAANKVHGLKNKFNGLSKTAKIAIVAGVLGFLAIAGLGFLLYFLRQRRQGMKEYKAYEAEQNKEASELLEYKNQMASGKFAQSNVRRL